MLAAQSAVAVWYVSFEALRPVQQLFVMQVPWEAALFPKAPPELGFWFRLLSGVRGLESGRGLRGASRDALGRILDALGRILDLLWHSSGNRMNVFYGICQDSAHVLKTCNCPHFWGFRLVRASAGSLPGSVRDPSGLCRAPYGTRRGLVRDSSGQCRGIVF